MTPPDFQERSNEFDEIVETGRQQNGKGDKGKSDGAGATPTVLPPPANPMQVAREFVARHCLHEDGTTLVLRYWRDGWWAWRGSHWRETERRYVMSLLYHFTEHAVFVGGKTFTPWAPTHHKIHDLIEALGAICILRDDISQPCWLDDRSSGAVVACENGLLDVAARRLLSHTPQFFNQTAVPFPYDAAAPEPKEWLAFLNALWSKEEVQGREEETAAEMKALAEWFGYVVSGRLDLHKILLNVGPTRGGKGVIARILTALIGRENVAGPTLNSLGGDFGLQPLIGKPLAIVSDARFSGRDGGVVVERLLSISGEDTLTVNRKYRDQWTGKLPSRLHVISNELPQLGDASAAIVGRIILLLLTLSWLGREDHDLEARLSAEMTGILNWALDGLHRLTVVNGNRFTRVPSADEALAQMRDLASPIRAFVREECETGSRYEIDVDALYGAFKVWAENNGHPKKTKQVFGRDLRAAHSAIRPAQRGSFEARYRVYPGIRLKPKPEECAVCGKPGANRCAWEGRDVWLHPECEAQFATDERVRDG
jgi:putative DNA primase/helicase